MVISEEEQEIIKKETRKLLEEFSKVLDKVKTDKTSNVERDIERRKEKADEEGKAELIEESDFRKIMLDNAPIKDEDFVIAEKKSW